MRINFTLCIVVYTLAYGITHSKKVRECFQLQLGIYLYYKDRCVFVCGHYDVRTLTSPPILKLWDTQGYLWLPYDLTEVIKLIGERFEPKKYFFSKKYPMSFLPHYCHSFRITVIPSVLLSFLPYYCHSFRIIVIPSVLLSFLPNYLENYKY